MEAKGHEFIESNLSAFMAGAIHILAKDKHYSGCRNILQTFYKKNFKDDIGRAMYMGNWLTDNSQLFAPDFFFDFKYNLPENLQKAENTMHILQEKLTQLFNDPLLASKKDEILPIRDILNKTLTGTITNIKTIRKNATRNKPKPQEFSYAKKDEWWEVAQSIIKVLGYRKFCMVDEKQLSDEVFMSIVSAFIDQNTDVPSEYLFKLNQYYPNDHLDRNFDPSHLKVENAKQKYADSWLKQQSTQNLPEEIMERKRQEYEDKGSLRRNCFDERNVSGSVYKYLNDYVEILGLKLNYLNKNLIMPYFVKSSKLHSDKDFLVLCAQLGHSLHGVEDFFAHSNYIELVVQNLDKLKAQMNYPDKYFSKNEFIDILNNSSEYEKTRFTRANNKAVREFTKSNAKQSEEVILTTGIFAEVDTFTSLYHLTFGILEEEIKKMANDNITDDPAVVVLQYIIKSLNDYIELAEQWPSYLDEKYNIAKGIKRKFNADILRFILNRNPEFKKEKIKIDGEEMDKYLDFIADLLNNLSKALTPLLIAKGGIVMVLKFVQVMLMLCFLPLMILFFFRQILLNKVEAVLLSQILQNGLDKLANFMEKDKLKLNTVKMYGTHSIIAKDESYRNEVMNMQAKRMALFMDEFIVLSMLLGCNPEKKEQTNMVSLVHKYLKHPCPDNSRTKQELEDDIVLYGTYRIVNVIDTATKKLVHITLKSIYNIGIINRIGGKSEKDYYDTFLELNGEFIKAEYLSKGDMRIDEMPVLPIKEFNTIILPYQKSDEVIQFQNNRYMAQKQLKEVVITAQAPINPNKMWKMQFFNKEDYNDLTSRSLLKNLEYFCFYKKPEERIDDVFFEKDKILFGSDNDAVSLIDNTPKIAVKEVKETFKQEIEYKKEYEKFVEGFIKIHYK